MQIKVLEVKLCKQELQSCKAGQLVEIKVVAVGKGLLKRGDIYGQLLKEQKLYKIREEPNTIYLFNAKIYIQAHPKFIS